MKLAILSGTFNPIHNSHIKIAKYVQKMLNYDEILLIPAFKPPCKDNCAPAHDRLEMVKLAASAKVELKVSEIEFEHNNKSYSYLTVKKLYERYDISGKIGFIIGTDAYIGLGTWYEADKLKNLVDFIVFEREIPFSDNRVKLMQRNGFNLIKASLPFEDISSSEIRKRIKNKESVSEFISKPVERYIYEHGLYK